MASKNKYGASAELVVRINHPEGDKWMYTRIKERIVVLFHAKRHTMDLVKRFSCASWSKDTTATWIINGTYVCRLGSYDTGGRVAFQLVRIVGR